jgi:diguanylate cyclase (GGDEF)-like protein
MGNRRKKLIGLLLCLAAVCVVGVHYATFLAVNWALKNEARSLGVDWAHHIEYRIPELPGMQNAQGELDPTKLPDPENFEKMLSDIISVGHIYQFDFINSYCHCDLSIGSYVADPDSPATKNDPHFGHDHRGSVSGFADSPAVSVNLPALKHLFNNKREHGNPKPHSGNAFQYPLDQQFVRQLIKDKIDLILINHNKGHDQPSTFAEVYHPVVRNGEVIYLLRVLVNLEEQAKIFTDFFRLGTLSGLGLLMLAFGYPAFRYLKAQKKQRETDKRAHFLAHHDVLTNLHNRNDFNEAVSDILWHCVEKRKSALLFLFDFNGFKEVNDYYGHQVGDRMLCEFASVLRKCVPDGGYIARLGGDEFVVVLGDIPGEDFRHQDYLNIPRSVQLRLPGSSQVIETTIAGGVVQYPRDAENVTELVQAADLALYAAKPNRAGEICEYSPQMKRDFFERLEIRDQFRLALENSQVEPYYQPIVNMNTGKVEGLEALARWRHPKRGILTPFVFGRVLEDPELGAMLGHQMLSKIVSDMRDWKENGVAFESVGLNVLDSDLKQKDFAENILSLLDENGLLPQDIAIEVTENCLFGEKKASLIAQLEKLRAAGSYIALDDFGTGYSSITQLKELPITAIKIDKSFVDNVINNLADQSIITALQNLGESMGFKLILEGIETIDQRDFLQEMGFSLAQGFYYSHPLKASQVPAFIKRQNSGYEIPLLFNKAS